MPLSRFVLSGLLLALAGCSNTSRTVRNHAQSDSFSRHADQTAKELSPLFTGTIQRQGEQALFTPCGSKQQWQLLVDDNFWQQWQQLGSPQSLQASLSGHLAAGESRGAPFRLGSRQVSHITTEQSLCQNTNENYLLESRR